MPHSTQIQPGAAPTTASPQGDKLPLPPPPLDLPQAAPKQFHNSSPEAAPLHPSHSSHPSPPPAAAPNPLARPAFPSPSSAEVPPPGRGVGRPPAYSPE